jgi:hypothetical protein
MTGNSRQKKLIMRLNRPALEIEDEDEVRAEPPLGPNPGLAVGAVFRQWFGNARDHGFI